MGSAVVVLASNVAFVVVFGVFVAALAVLAVIIVVWAWRRDKPARSAWKRQRQALVLPEADPAANGHRPVASDRPPTDPRP